VIHENFGIERDTSHVSITHPLYGRANVPSFLGPDYYSFTRGGVHFVASTRRHRRHAYYGHVDSLQLAARTRSRARAGVDCPVVTFDHIPFFTTFEIINDLRPTRLRRRSSRSAALLPSAQCLHAGDVLAICASATTCSRSAAHSRTEK